MKEMFLNTKRGQLYYEIDEAPDAKAVLFICHGLGGSASEGHLKRLGRRLAKYGITAVRLDFGNNMGKSYGTWEETNVLTSLQDLYDLLAHARGHQKLAVFVAGHSLGGLIVGKARLKDKGVAGKILLSPVYSMLKIFEKNHTLAYERWEKTGYFKLHDMTGKTHKIGLQFKTGLEEIEAQPVEQMPTLIVVGELEPHLHPDAQKYRDEIRGSDFQFLPNAHHDYVPHQAGDSAPMPVLAKAISEWIKKTVTKK